MLRDADGDPMLLKLYKEDDGTMLYWEAWDEENEVIIHFGVLGQMGETTAVPIPEFEPPDSAVKRHAEEAREAGFKEIEHEELFELIVRYPLQKNATTADAEFAIRAEEALNEALGWTGLGHCDGNDVGSDVINVYCYVVDPQLAIGPIVEELKNAEMLDGAIIAYQDKTDENFHVLYPENFAGVFDY